MPLDSLSPTAGWRARLALEFERRGPRTVLAKREHDGPLVVQKALHPEGDAVCHAIVLHPPSGLVGGDELRLTVRAGEGAHALLTTPGAGKWYRSAGRFARQEVHLDVGAGACVEWLPQENILFDGALASLAWSATLAPDARLVAWDIACLGRTASGEKFATGECRLDARLAREGRPLWIERGVIGAGGAVMHSPAGLAGLPVFGTLAFVAPEIAPEWVTAARACGPADTTFAATALPGVLLVRYRGDSTEAARKHFTAVWHRLRRAVTGREPVEPRIWRT
jgi:urease accessory protein